MPKNFGNLFGINHLVGASHVYEKGQEDGALGRHIRNLLQKDARDRVRKSNAAPLVDNGGGTAAVQYEQSDSGVLAASDLTGLTDGVTAASLNTAADTVMDALAVILERLNDAVFGPLGAGSADEGPGTIAASGTVAVIDDSASAQGDNTDAASAASARPVQNDLLHAQKLVIHAIDDARVMVGLARQVPAGPGSWDGTGDLTFADAGPDTITRASGSWVDDGFMPGDTIVSKGSADNNGTFTIDDMTALVLTLVAADVLTAEVITAATEGATYTLVSGSRRTFPGRLEGADTLDIDGAPSAGGSAWTLSFETGAAGISNAANVNPPVAAILLADWDLLVDQLSDNVALMADLVDEITGHVLNGAEVVHQIPFFIPQTEYAAGTSVFVTSPVGGRIRNVRSIVMDEATTGIGTFTLEINGSAVTGASLVVATGAAIGVFDSDAVADSGDPGDATTNYVSAGQQIEIVGDGTPTAGALMGWIEVVETGEDDENLAGYAG
jgi:hypothetical protein